MFTGSTEWYAVLFSALSEITQPHLRVSVGQGEDSHPALHSRDPTSVNEKNCEDKINESGNKLYTVGYVAIYINVRSLDIWLPASSDRHKMITIQCVAIEPAYTCLASYVPLTTDPPSCFAHDQKARIVGSSLSCGVAR